MLDVFPLFCLEQTKQWIIQTGNSTTTHQRQDQDGGLIAGKIQRMNVPRCGYYSVKDNKRPHTMMGTNEELAHHTPSSDRHNMSYRLNSNTLNPEMVTSSDPDSEPEELSEIDKELARKRRELKQIEKQLILCKKTPTIGMTTTTGPPLKSILKANTPCQMTTTTRPPLKSILKAKTSCQMMFKEDREEDLSSKVDSSARNTLPFMNTGEKDVGFSCSKQPSAYNNRPLNERVDGIVQRRRKAWKVTTAFSTPNDHLPPPNPVEKTNVSTLNKDDHALKLRAKALMNRHRHSGLLDSHGEVPVKPQPPSQSPTTVEELENLTVIGLQRFLSVLKKGVDIETLLNKTLIDHNEHPPTGQGLLHSSQTPVVKEKSGVCESDSQRDCQSRSEERKTELLNQHISNEGCKRNFQREEKSSQSDDRGDHHFGSSQHQHVRSDFASAIPSYISVRHSEYSAYHSDTSNCASLNYGSNDIPPSSSSYPPAFCNYSMTPLCPSADTATLDGHVYPHPYLPAGCNTAPGHSHFNSDLSLIEGQSGQRPLPRDLHINPQCQTKLTDMKIQTKQPAEQKHGQELSIGKKELYTIEQNSDLSLSEGQTGRRQSDRCYLHIINTVQHSEYTDYHRDTSNGLSSTAWKDVSSGLCNSMNPVRPSADTGALLGQVYPHPHPPAGYNDAPGHSCLNSDLSRTETEGLQGQQLEVDSEYIDYMAERYRRVLRPVRKRTRFSDLKKELKYVRRWIAQANGDPKHNSEWLRKQIAAKEQDILMILNPNSDLSLIEGQTGQQSAINTLTKAEFQAEEMKMAGQKESQRSIQGQQLEVGAKYIDHIAPVYRRVLRSVKGCSLQQQLCELVRVRRWIALANIDPKHNYEYLKKRLAAKEQDILMILSSDLSLIEGQTGQQSAVNNNNNPFSVSWLKNTSREQQVAHLKEVAKEIEEIKANLMKEVAAAGGVVRNTKLLAPIPTRPKPRRRYGHPKARRRAVALKSC